MNRTHRDTNRSEKFFWLSISMILLSLGALAWMVGDLSGSSPFIWMMGILLIVVVLRYPLVGFGFVIVSTTIVELLPRISLLSSVIPLIGAGTLLIFFVQQKQSGQDLREWHFTSVEVLGLVYFLWVVLSNPNASFFGADRSWILTFVQLWLLMWMARKFIRSERDHVLIMGVVALGILVSAIVAVQGIGLEFGFSERAAGLSGGANTAARYFVYGILLFNLLRIYFHQQAGKRLLILVGIVVLMLALIATGSRTGLLLLGVAIFFLSQRFLIGKQRSFALWLILGLGLGWIFVQVSGSNLDPARIFDAVLSGSDTVGARYNFWRAGWAMWQDFPVFGVGVGMFRYYLLSYWQSSDPIVAFTPHNTYIQVLAETGIVGFVLFSSLIILAIRNYWANIQAASKSGMSHIYWTWLIILVVLLVGGMTKTDSIDKFLWFLLGMSANKQYEILE